VHHSTLPFKKLRSMKVTDRLSCSVIVRQANMALPEILSRDDFFGQFGKILALRVLQEAKPLEVFVRYLHEGSARRAIEWCNRQPLLFSGAHHGYQKYCVDFLNGQVCQKRTCRNRHSWCESSAAAHDQFTRRRAPSRGSIANTKNISNSKVVSTRTSTAQRANAANASTMSVMHSMQQQMMALLSQNGQQASYIQQLLRTIKQLENRNSVLQDLLLESVGSALDLNELPDIVDDVLRVEGANASPSNSNTPSPFLL